MEAIRTNCFNLQPKLKKSWVSNSVVIVSSLGMFEPVSILNENDTAFEKQLNTNLMPAYHLYRHFGKKMIAQREGHFAFTICSVASLRSHCLGRDL